MIRTLSPSTLFGHRAWSVRAYIEPIDIAKASSSPVDKDIEPIDIFRASSPVDKCFKPIDFVRASSAVDRGIELIDS